MNQTLQRIKLILFALLITVPFFFTLRTAYKSIAVASDGEVTGTILVWHGWPEEEAAVLQEIVDKFTDLHPDARVLVTAVPPDQLQARFVEAAEIGFGPDLLIGPGEWVWPLAEERLIIPLNGHISESILARYLPEALDSLRVQGSLYGLPESVQTQALFYNRELVSEPAGTLDELMSQARNNSEIGISTSFERAFWGIQAFGGRLFDAEEDTVLDPDGFVNWLNWLKRAQDSPAFILSTDQNALRALFMDGRLAYLVDDAEAIPDLEENVDAETLGVLRLPAGPAGSAGPFLYTEALMLGRASSAGQTALALSLAQFITNAEQQTTLMRRLRHVPANNRVRVSARLSPVVSTLANQARSAVPFRPTPQMETISRLGNEAYARVLEGVLSPAEAIDRFVADLTDVTE